MLKERVPKPQEDYTSQEMAAYGRHHFSECLGIMRRDFDHPIEEKITLLNAEAQEFILGNAALAEQAEQALMGNPSPEVAQVLHQQRLSIPRINERHSPEVALQYVTQHLVRGISYLEALEKQRTTGIVFKGFENEVLTPDAEERMKEAFGEELLRSCLVDTVHNMPDTVFIPLEGNEFFLTTEQYRAWKAEMPGISQLKPVAAEKGVMQNRSLQYLPLPILLFNYEDAPVNTITHLDAFEGEEKFRRHKLGTIAHEFAHRLYRDSMDLDQMQDWYARSQEAPDPTRYITILKERNAPPSLIVEETFTESVRLLTTSPEYGQEHIPTLQAAVQEYFPSLKPMRI